MAGKEGKQELNLAALDPQQLQAAQRQIENDITRYAESMGFFQKSAQIYAQANEAIKELGDSKEGQPLLLPLTSSLYVSGQLASVDQVLVDVGTGYYVEMSAKEGQEYCERKFQKLQNAMAELNEVLRGKQGQLITVRKVLDDKLAQAAEAQAARPAAGVPGP